MGRAGTLSRDHAHSRCDLAPRVEELRSLRMTLCGGRGDTNTREANDASGSEQIGVLHVDPAGERAPAVRLMDGTDLGPLDNVLSRFTVKDLSEEETEVLRLWEKSHDWRVKAREWNFDPFEVTVLDREGSTLAKVQLREGYQGPIV